MLRRLIANGDAVANPDKWLVITEAGKSHLHKVSMQALVSAHAWIKSPSADILVKKMVEKSLFWNMYENLKNPVLHVVPRDDDG